MGSKYSISSNLPNAMCDEPIYGIGNKYWWPEADANWRGCQEDVRGKVFKAFRCFSRLDVKAEILYIMDIKVMWKATRGFHRILVRITSLALSTHNATLPTLHMSRHQPSRATANIHNRSTVYLVPIFHGQSWCLHHICKDALWSLTFGNFVLHY